MGGFGKCLRSGDQRMALACDNTRVEHPLTSGDQAAAAPAPPAVTVRYWGAARAAAGREEDVVSARSVADALAAVRALHADKPRLAQVLAMSSLLLGDKPLGSSDLSQVPARNGDVIEVLPPFAGG